MGTRERWSGPTCTVQVQRKSGQCCVEANTTFTLRNSSGVPFWTVPGSGSLPHSHCGTVLAFRSGPFQGMVLSRVHTAEQFWRSVLDRSRERFSPAFTPRNSSGVPFWTVPGSGSLPRSHRGTVLAFRSGPFQGAVLSRVHTAEQFWRSVLDRSRERFSPAFTLHCSVSNNWTKLWAGFAHVVPCNDFIINMRTYARC